MAPFRIEKIAVFAPMPSASVRIETAVKAFDAASDLAPYRTSCDRRSIADSQRISLTCSLTCSTPPISRRADRSASSSDMPAATLCSVALRR
jgi:hypothetical protein